MAEPTLSEVHADLVGRLKQDERLREVEKQVAVMSNLPEQIQRMEARLVAAISDARPKSPWPAAAVYTSIVTLILGIAALLYQK